MIHVNLNNIKKEGQEFKLDDFPSDVTIEITRECPLNCLICSSNGGEAHPLELSLDKWIEVINESIELGAQSFLISGGEPFSSSYFKTICEYLSEKDVSLSIYSSGNYNDGRELHPLRYDDLVFVSNLGSIRLVFSLEGSNEVTHDFMTCVEGSYHNTISSIRRAVGLGIDTEIHFVPTQVNYKELPDVVSLASNLGVTKISVLRFVSQGRGSKNAENLQLNDEDLLILREIFHQLNGSPRVRIGSPFNSFLLNKNYQCNAGKKRMTIRYDGLVVPCEAMKFLAEEYNDNDVKLFTLKDIWYQSKLFQLARNFHKTLNPECVSCEFLSKCWGGCPAQRLLGGNLLSMDPYCSKKIQDSIPLTILRD